MISPILGHDIKHSRSEALQSELDEFLARGGKINGGAIAVKYEFNNRKVPVINHNTEYLEASKQRREMQVPVIQDYAKWGGEGKWVKLSNAVNGAVSVGQLSNVSRGVTSIKDLDIWKKVAKAIEDLKEVK